MELKEYYPVIKIRFRIIQIMYGKEKWKGYRIKGIGIQVVDVQILSSLCD